jgi:hypothetical protein
MNIEFLNLLNLQEGRKEKNRKDEPIHVIIHIYMEVSQENSLCSYLKQKCLFFKNEGQEGKTSPDWGLVPMGGGRFREGVKEDKYDGNIFGNGIMRPVKTIVRRRREGEFD